MRVADPATVRSQDTTRRSMPHAAVIVLFMVGLLFPGQIFIGELRLSIYRIVLIIWFLPALFKIISIPEKKFYIIDYSIILYASFCSFSFIYHKNGIPTLGIFIIETLGPYFMARAYITNVRDLTFAFKTMMLLILALLPFTIIENFTGRSLLLEVGRSAFPYAFPDSVADMRHGLNRPQVVFEHAILYGMFCTMAVAPAYYIVGYGGWFVVRTFYLALMLVATLLSLSAGPLVATAFQLLLIGWDHGFFLRAIKWKTFLLGLLSAYVVVELFSSRPPIHVFIDYFTFNAGTAFTRVKQWDCGMLSVAKNPILGFGLGGDWTRCPGVTNSIDNFFLAMAMRNGAPAILFLLLGIILITIKAGRAPVDGPREAWARKGLLFAIVGVSVGAATVHLWNATYAMLFFLLGSAMWVIDRGRKIEMERRAEKLSGTPSTIDRPRGRGAPPLSQGRRSVAP